MSDVERAPLAPLDARTRITEDDRARVYDLIGKQLDYLINGPGSYYADGGPKSPQVIGEDIMRFKNHVSGLKSFVDDPASILDAARVHLDAFSKKFNDAIESNQPKDSNTISPLPSPDDNVTDPDVPGQYPRPQPSAVLIRTRPAMAVRSSNRARGNRFVSGIADQLK